MTNLYSRDGSFDTHIDIVHDILCHIAYVIKCQKMSFYDICYGATVGPELSLSGPPTLRLHVWPKAFKSSHIVSKFGPQSNISGPGPKYYRRTGLLYIITHPGRPPGRPPAGIVLD